MAGNVTNKIIRHQACHLNVYHLFTIETNDTLKEITEYDITHHRMYSLSRGR